MSSTHSTDTKNGRQRRANGQFAQAAGTHDLLDQVAKIARHAAGEHGDPHRIGKRRFNRSRLALGVQGASPDAIRHRLGLTLADAIDMALTEAAERLNVRRQDRTGQSDRDLPEALIGILLRACRFQTGQTPSPASYNAWAKREQQARIQRGMIENHLPNAGTITTRMGSWEQALASAGIEEPAPTSGLHRHAGGARPHAELLDACIDAIGCLPSRRYFAEWCKRMDEPLGRASESWSQTVKAVRALRNASGKWTPQSGLSADLCPPLPDPVEAEDGSRSRRRQRRTREEAIASLRRYGAEHLKGRPTQADYRACCAKDPLLLAPGTLEKFGKFQELCQEAGI